MITKDGREVWLWQSVSLIFDNDTDTVTGFRVVARDITGRKQAEEALRRAKKVQTYSGKHGRGLYRDRSQR